MGRGIRKKIKNYISFYFWNLVIKLLKIFNTNMYNQNNKILVIDFQLIGDSVMVSSIFKNIKHNLNDGEKLEVLCFDREKEIFDRCGYVDCVLSIQRYNDFKKINNQLPSVFAKFSYWYYLINVAKDRLMNRYRMVIVPRWDVDTIYTGIMALLTNAQCRIGYNEDVTEDKRIQNYYRNHYFTKVFTHKANCHEIDKYLDLIEFTGYKVTDRRIKLNFHPLKSYKGNRLLSPYVILCVDASSAKREWNIENFWHIAKYLSDKGYISILLGTKKSKEEIFFMNNKDINYISLIGKTTIGEAIDLIGNSSLYIGLDTGLSHIAAAVGVPGIVLFSNAVTEEDDNPASVLRMRPRSEKIFVIQPQHPLYPCKTHCVSETAHCINLVSVNDVKKIINKILRIQ